MALTEKPVVGRRAFVSLPYVPGGAGGSLRPPKPASCPDPLATCNNRCLIHFSRWRDRVHGPGFRLASMHCLTHSRRFTVYPPGWTPYGRAPLVLLDHRGRTVETDGEENRWNDTEFGALVDAARGNIWPEPVTLGPSVEKKSGELVRSRRTQRRHVNPGPLQLICHRPPPPQTRYFKHRPRRVVQSNGQLSNDGRSTAKFEISVEKKDAAGHGGER